MYKLTKVEYNHLLDNAVTATYKRATEGIEDIINKEGMKYTKLADIPDRIGRISKSILDKINICLCKKLKLDEWKNTTYVINWFNKIDKKHLHRFTIFDIKDLYPLIKETLLKNAIQFAAEHGY